MNNIIPAEAQDLIQKEGATVIDVRTPEEYASGHIQGAINLNIQFSNFEDELKRLDTQKCYIVNCQHGFRSSRASKRMKNLGFSNVNNLLGGLDAWRSYGLGVEV
ncbi:MAG: rhodanese-like domain-containing protein [Candidatus Pacebacteria bacterium]|nr:rhodanese-like domain-containing protein [Candidatus Paceibacterota bacterium]